MIERPPFIDNGEILPKISPELLEKISHINDEYLYWSDVKYRANDANLSSEDLWRQVKRTRLMHDIEVWPKMGLHFSLTGRMQRLCHEFDMSFGGSWEAAAILPEDKLERQHYLAASIMEEAISSSRMEGASTTREVAKDMLKKGEKPRNRSERMILNNYETIRFISANKHEPLTPEMLLHVHELMTAGTLENREDAGRFRTGDEIVVSNGITGEVVHRPPSHELLPEFARELCRFFNEKTPATTAFLHPIIKGVIVHFLVAYYHPFVDGNGRTARALFYWYMLRENYWLMEYMSISHIIYKSKVSYEKAFLYTECDDNDMGYFITYNLGVIAKAFDSLRKYLEKKQGEHKQAEQFMRLGGLSRQQAEIIRIYNDNSNATLEAKDIAARFGVSRVTAKAYLDALVAKGILRRINLDGRTHAYVRSENFYSIINSRS